MSNILEHIFIGKRQIKIVVQGLHYLYFFPSLVMEPIFLDLVFEVSVDFVCV